MYKLINHMAFKRIIALFFLCIFFSSFCTNTFAQETEINLSQFTADDYLGLVLPPIDTLFAKIVTVPKAKQYDYKILEEESNIKSEKRKWLNFFKVSSSYSYGYLGAEYITNGNLVPAFYQTSQSAQNYYNVGISIALPFADVIDMGNKVKQNKIKLEQIKYEKENFLDEQKMVIIELYSNAIQYLSLMKITLDAKNLAKIEYEIGEKDFVNGKISPSDLSKIVSSESNAYSSYEILKSNLSIALLKLEVLCNYKFTKLRK